MLKDNEYFYVKSYHCESTEDDFEKGEIGGVWSFWDGKGLESGKMKFKTVEEALEQVLDEQCFDGAASSWTDFFKESGDKHDRGRFDCDVTVDVNNSAATDSQIEAWKNGKLKLYNCHIVVYIGIRSERELSDEDYKTIDIG